MIKFSKILAEIGVNKPGLVYAKQISNDYFKIDNFGFWIGRNMFPDYYFTFIDNDDIEKFSKWRYFKLCRILGKHIASTFYGIPKSQVVVKKNKLKEIGINKPNKSAEDILELIHFAYSKLYYVCYNNIIDILKKNGYALHTAIPLWLSSINQITRNKIYNEIKNVTDSYTKNSS